MDGWMDFHLCFFTFPCLSCAILPSCARLSDCVSASQCFVCVCVCFSCHQVYDLFPTTGLKSLFPEFWYLLSFACRFLCVCSVSLDKILSIIRLEIQSLQASLCSPFQWIGFKYVWTGSYAALICLFPFTQTRLIVIQQRHQLLGLVYETAVQLAFKLLVVYWCSQTLIPYRLHI